MNFGVRQEFSKRALSASDVLGNGDDILADLGEIVAERLEVADDFVRSLNDSAECRRLLRLEGCRRRRRVSAASDPLVIWMVLSPSRPLLSMPTTRILPHDVLVGLRRSPSPRRLVLVSLGLRFSPTSSTFPTRSPSSHTSLPGRRPFADEKYAVTCILSLKKLAGPPMSDDGVGQRRKACDDQQADF